MGPSLLQLIAESWSSPNLHFINNSPALNIFSINIPGM